MSSGGQSSHNLQYQPRLLEGYSVGPPTSGNFISPVATPHDPLLEDSFPLRPASVLTLPSQTHPPVMYCQANMEIQAMTAPSLVESGQRQAEVIIDTSDV